MDVSIRPRAALLLLAALAVPASGSRKRGIPHPDHAELEAGISAPFQGQAARTFELRFRFPGAEPLVAVLWRVEILNDRGAAVRTLHGETAMAGGVALQEVQWDGLDAFGAPLAAGFYDLRLSARAATLPEVRAASGEPVRSRVERWLSR